MKKILFSPIGGTDPISNFRDGAMLHICRIYKPDIVYLYLSKEMCEFQEKDDRYRYCLEQLGKKLDKHFEVIEIQKNELEEVQVFDTFMKEYREILNDIRDKNPESEIILNVSSGTPAMKSALQILAAMGEIHMQAIQVSTPKKKINPHEEDRDDYDVEGYWELNEDNDEELFVNRCKESEHFYLLDEVRKETIIKHIKAYYYVAALQIAGEMTEPFDDETMALLKAANSRLQLNIGEIDNLLKPYNISIIPVRIEQQQKIFEYLLSLEIKIKKEQYGDFLRAITPAVVELFKIATKEYTGIDWKKYCWQNTKTKQWKWDHSKIESNKALKNALDQAYLDRGGFTGKDVYSDHLTAIIDELSKDAEIKRMTKQIRDIEITTRNISAHNLVSITASWVKKYSGYTPEEIYGFLKNYVKKLRWNIKKEDWNSYDAMNEIIIGKIGQ